MKQFSTWAVAVNWQPLWLIVTGSRTTTISACQTSESICLRVWQNLDASKTCMGSCRAGIGQDWSIKSFGTRSLSDPDWYTGLKSFSALKEAAHLERLMVTGDRQTKLLWNPNISLEQLLRYKDHALGSFVISLVKLTGPSLEKLEICLLLHATSTRMHECLNLIASLPAWLKCATCPTQDFMLLAWWRFWRLWSWKVVIILLQQADFSDEWLWSWQSRVHVAALQTLSGRYITLSEVHVGIQYAAI